jgi:hypothetical protein
MVPCAFLRVYRPLDAFEEPERGKWERYIVAGGDVAPARPVYRQQAVAGSGRVGLLAATGGDGADVRFVDGVYHVCPWRTHLRVLASILALRESGPAEVAEAFVPEAEVRRAARELARHRRRDPDAVPAMLDSSWHVPLHWFVLFDDEERRLVERPEGGHRLFYWARIGAARRRAARALTVLRRTQLSPVAETVKELAEWLSSFDERSSLELDYADVSDTFGWDELDNDHSARDVQQALDALESGDVDVAGERYRTVAARWAEVRSRESLN